MNYICMGDDNSVYTAPDLSGLKNVYAAIKCGYTDEAMKYAKLKDIIDENNVIANIINRDVLWMEMCQLVKDIDDEENPKPKQKRMHKIKK